MMLPGGQSIINAFLRVSSIQPIIIEDLLLVVSLRVFWLQVIENLVSAVLKYKRNLLTSPVVRWPLVR